MPWKKGDPNHPRRGKGAGKPGGAGKGWGGEAKGASASRFTSEPQPMQGKAWTADVVRDREARLALLKDHLFNLATSADRQETQLSAAVAYLNREEGMPIARSVTTTVDDVSQLSDLDLATEIARLDRELGKVEARSGEAEAGKPPDGVSPIH
jgi:hypothetical protein